MVQGLVDNILDSQKFGKSFTQRDVLPTKNQVENPAEAAQAAFLDKSFPLVIP